MMKRSNHGKMVQFMLIEGTSSMKLTCSKDCKSRFAVHQHWNHFRP